MSVCLPLLGPVNFLEVTGYSSVLALLSNLQWQAFCISYCQVTSSGPYFVRRTYPDTSRQCWLPMKQFWEMSIRMDPVGARFSAPVQTGPGAHTGSCTMGAESFPGGKERPGPDADPSPPSSAVVMKG